MPTQEEELTNGIVARVAAPNLLDLLCDLGIDALLRVAFVGIYLQ